MKYYLAKLVFRIIVSGETRSQFDVQYRLLEAKSNEDAFHKAKQIGFLEEENFLSGKKKVEWKFIDVESVDEISSLENGAQLFSFTHEEDAPEKFIQSVKSKATHLQLRVADTFVEF